MQQYIEFFSNHPMLSLAWLVIAGLLIFGWAKQRFSSVAQVTPTELTLQVNRHDAVVLDIRAEADYAKGHITDAKHLTAADIAAQKLAGLEKKKDVPIIVVCQAGMSAQKVAANLAKQGFSKVSVLQGGMSSWTSANLPIVKAKK
ncbi:rhodanese-like domain-containing protein [Rheinheimera sp. MMS21-TC3]|uniref:rhodanese-like domain-containing protein n=1 Tax=Rheinheimera sp. MMS21-TC3 TaxID=3072790 RepID=UPI0028C3D87E|nr:rhodanese-like domain-containing protein [Rheinheimera sp. MMS21-TC3]WNO60389.1 rhodanese-like domain-containing protein [Rheinheimera sp. MMS21-TC3]